MAIKATEVGKTFRLSTGYDMSGNSALALKFTHSDGTTFTATNPAVTAPAVAVVDPDLGTIPANKYMEYKTTGSDFTKAGVWSVVGTYTDGSPKTFYSELASFTVGAGA